MERRIRFVLNLVGFRRLCVVSLAFFLLVAQGQALAQTYLPTTKIGTASLISPSAATTYFGAATTSTNSLSWGTPKEIVELTRALNNNPDQIYDFVLNNIDVTWTYGLTKGATGALVDRYGTAFDQVHLMVSLLRQAGFATTYKAGTITLTGAQFSAWSGIANASAACQLLSSGGIPAVINGTTTANCGYGSATVSTITLGHIWVSVVIGGTTYVFDPAYKTRSFKAGVNLATVTGLVSGQPLTAAAGTIGTQSGASYVVNLNTDGANGLNAKLQGYGSALLTHINSNLLTAKVDELIGGPSITRYDASPGGLRQTVLPYTSTTNFSWTGGIPDQYRTKLTVKTEKRIISNAWVTMWDRALFADEIYSRRLIVDTDFDFVHSPLVLSATFGAHLRIVDEAYGVLTLNDFTNADTWDYYDGKITLTVGHPYAATTTVAGDYMDATIVKNASLLAPTLIVNAWGDAGEGLVAKWGSRPDKKGPRVPVPNVCGEFCQINLPGTLGDGRREQEAATWITQSSSLARMNAAIAKSVHALHHAVGIASGSPRLHQAIPNPQYPDEPQYWRINDSFDHLDVDSNFSLTSLTANASDRRAAIQTFATMSEALEGSAVAQIADMPDVTSIATRFEWGNRPPTSTEEDPVTTGPRRFYQFNTGNVAAAAGLLRVQGQTSTTDDGVTSCSFVEIGNTEITQRKSAVSTAISDYVAAGYTVSTSEEAFLGPGRRTGFLTQVDPNTDDACSHNPSKQRGGAFVATKYVGGEPVEISNLTVGIDYYAYGVGAVRSKGGGGGAQPTIDDQYNPAEAANLIKAQFIDKSSALGVDLRSGMLTYSSPAALKVGNGDFPHSLSASYAWVGGRGVTRAGGKAENHIAPPQQWTTNWHNTLSMSSNASEAMGASDIRGSASVIAALLAAQDIYKSANSVQRDVAAALVASWWMQNVSGNVVTSSIGASTRQFVRIVDGTWIAPGAGPLASLTVTGTRSPEAYLCTDPYPLSRGWNYSAMSFKVKNAQGDEQNWGFWQNYVGADFCIRVHGFRLNSWTFPYGVNVNLVYGPGGTVDPSGNPYSGKTDELVEVNNNLGRKIHFIDGGEGGFDNGLTAGDFRFVSAVSDTTDTVLSHADPAGNSTTFSYGSVPWYQSSIKVLTQINTPDNPTLPALRYDYDTLHRVKEAKDAIALQKGTRGPYQFLVADGVRGERIDPAGGRYAVFYDADKRPFRYINELGYVTKADYIKPDGKYDFRGRVATYTYPEGGQEKLEYDDRNNTTKLTRVAKPGSGLSNIVVQASWNSTWNKPDWVRDALNNQTDFAYYASGSGKSLLQTATRPSPNGVAPRPLYSYTYNAFGQPLVFTDPTSLVTQNTYDPANNGNLLSKAINPTGLNSITSYTYDGQGDVKTVTDPRGYVTEQLFDLYRRVTDTKAHNGNISATLLTASRTTYDPVGRVTQQQQSRTVSGLNVTAWDTIKTTTYTPTGKPFNETDGDGRIVGYDYDAMDRVSLITDPILRRTQFEYDLAGQKLREIRGYATPRQQNYATYTYSPDGQNLSITDSRSSQTTYTYDGFNRLKRTCFPGTTNCSTTPTGSPALYEELGYNANGFTTSRRNRAGEVLGYTPDNLSRMLTKVMPLSGGGSLTTTWGYDAAGRATSLSDTAGNSLVNTYDATKARLLTSTQQTIPGLTGSKTVGYQYDAAFNRTRLTWPDSNYVQYVYDGLNRMSTATDNGTTLLATYGYNPRSQRISLTYGNGAAVAYTYTTAGDLDALSHDFQSTGNDLTLDYAYSPAHQLSGFTATNAAYLWSTSSTTTASYATANALNQYPTVNAVSQSYDTKGNLTGDGTWTHSYDAENHLLSSSKAGMSVTYAYDPLGHRTTKMANAASTFYIGDFQDDEIAEYNAAGTLLNRYVPGPGADEPIAAVTAAGLRSYFHEDKIGSVVAMSGASAARTEGPYFYDPYGNGTISTGTAFKYTGRRLDPETGLYYYRARYYSTNLGRFLQADPVGYESDLNLYSYTRNDPLDYSDPTGNCPQCAVIGGIIGAVSNLLVQIDENDGNIEVSRVVAAGVFGAISGGLGGTAAQAIKGIGGTFLQQAAAAVVSSVPPAVVGTQADKLLSGKEVTPSNMLDGTVSATIGSIVGSGVGAALEKAGAATLTAGSKLTVDSVLKAIIPSAQVRASAAEAASAAAGTAAGENAQSSKSACDNKMSPC